MIFQRRQKAVLWSKGLNPYSDISSRASCLIFGLSLLPPHKFMYLEAKALARLCVCSSSTGHLWRPDAINNKTLYAGTFVLLTWYSTTLVILRCFTFYNMKNYVPETFLIDVLKLLKKKWKKYRPAYKIAILLPFGDEIIDSFGCSQGPEFGPIRNGI